MKYYLTVTYVDVQGLLFHLSLVLRRQTYSKLTCSFPKDFNSLSLYFLYRSTIFK